MSKKDFVDLRVILALYEHGNFKIKVGIKPMTKKKHFKLSYYTTLLIPGYIFIDVIQ